MEKEKQKKEDLVKFRRDMGIFSISEICEMFGCGRSYIDFMINDQKLNYITPNNRDRFVYLNDFLNCMRVENQKEEGKKLWFVKSVWVIAEKQK